jgi:hypothetical protein
MAQHVEDPSVAVRETSARWPGEPPELSVIVPTHGRAAFLPELVEALERQSLDPQRFETVIVDDSSPDDTWDVLASIVDRTGLRMTVARAASNRGPGASRNLGVRLSRGPMLAFTDDDCLPTPAWAEAMVAALAKGADLVQGRTNPRQEDRDVHGPWARTVWIETPSPWWESCNIGWRREPFTSLGGFPEARPGVPGATRWHFGEDSELGWKLRSGGGRTQFVPDALVHHRVYPGRYADWLREQRRLALFPDLVRRAPGLRRALPLGVFLSRRTAVFDLALAGSATALALWNPWPLTAILPWIAVRIRDSRHRPGRPVPVRFAQLAVGDLLGFVSLAAGSIRARRLLL